MKMNSQAIAAALTRVRAAADTRDAHILQSAEILRPDRELLIATGWLQEIIRGWYMLVRPDVATGDTAAWYVNFWDFIRVYLGHRFGTDYCLTAESSLDLHIENPTVPKQVVAMVKRGAGLTKLMYDTSLMTYTDIKNFPTEIMQKEGINVMSLAYALCKVTATYFQHHPRDAEIALRSIKTPAEISRIIIRHNWKSAGARLVGAYYFLQADDTAAAIKNDLAAVGMLIDPLNPFQQNVPLLSSTRVKSPAAERIRAMWAQGRDAVIANFPRAPGLPRDSTTYLQHIDEIYQYDAYNSLSIEGYQVTPELIKRIQNNQWDPWNNKDDDNSNNALAAKGYYDTFLQVKSCVKQIIKGDNGAKVVKENLQTWYQHLFAPSVKAGIIPAESLVGYRNERVFIRNSRHSPPAKDAVIDAMEVFFDCLANETNSAVNAVLGHYFFVFIHPYMDGNGRIARFLMNAFLASGGYPWTVVRVENRNQYISTLENTHMEFEMGAFARFIAGEMAVVI